MWSSIYLILYLVSGARFGVATNFRARGDRWNPVPYAACLHRDLRPTDLVVAHPTLPCLSRVLVYVPRTRRWVVARVGDRGPRRAMVDLAPATAERLHANGYERVVMVPLGPGRGR